MLNVSPLAGAVVRAVTVSVPPDVLAVMSVACPRRFAVVVSLENVRMRPLNWSVTAAAGEIELVGMLVVVAPVVTVPVTVALTALIRRDSASMLFAVGSDGYMADASPNVSMTKH